MTNYYKNQLDRVASHHSGKMAMQARIVSSHDSTKWIDLNDESAKELITWLQNNFPNCMDEKEENI